MRFLGKRRRNSTIVKLIKIGRTMAHNAEKWCSYHSTNHNYRHTRQRNQTHKIRRINKMNKSRKEKWARQPVS